LTITYPPGIPVRPAAESDLELGVDSRRQT
jgi:hypothetical protein